MLERRGVGLTLHPSHCTKCAQPVTLHVLEPLMIGGLRRVPWVCPFCEGANTSDIEGRLGYVSRGQPDPDPERSPDSKEIPLHIQAYPRCPKCRRRLGKIIPWASEQAWVLYYRCKSCGHLWKEPRTRPRI